MLKNKNIRILISLIVAVLLWGYVVGSVSPNTTKQVRNIPVTLTHTAELAERGLAVSSMNLESVDIEVSGSRVVLSDIDPSNFTATCDMASASKGENDIAIAVKVDSGITIKERSATRATVVVEDLVQKPLDVQVIYSGTFGEGQDGMAVEIGTPQVSVSGAESKVNQVDHARATVDASRLSEDLTSIMCEIQPVSADGTPISGVSLSQDSVYVKTILSLTKEVDLNVEVINESVDDLIRSAEIPDKIFIEGRADLISDIQEVSAADVDISEVDESKDIPLDIELPEGISLSGRNKELMAKVTVKEQKEKSFSFTPQDVEITGYLGTMTYTLPQSGQIIVTAKGDEDHLKNISKNDIALSVDVTSINSVGGHMLPIKATIAHDTLILTVSPETIEVTAK